MISNETKKENSIIYEDEIVTVIDNLDRKSLDYEDDIIVLDKVIDCEIGFANKNEEGDFVGYVPYGPHALEIRGSNPKDLAYDALYTSYTAEDGDTYSNVIDKALEEITKYYQSRKIAIDEMDPYDHFWVYPGNSVGKKKTNFKWLKLCLQFITATINEDKPMTLNIEFVYMLYNHSMNIFDEPETENPFHVEVVEYDLLKPKPRNLNTWDVYMAIDSNLSQIKHHFTKNGQPDILLSIKNKEVRKRLIENLME